MRPILAIPLQAFADRDAVADRLPLRQHVVEKLVVAIDDDASGRFPARKFDDMALIGLGY